MCRFVAYLGDPIIVEDIIVKPANSLIHQSYDAEESVMTVNGDGFGLGWYNSGIRKEPGLFKSVLPAWNDMNLLSNASIIKTNCFFAHIRAATNGGVSIENCHPFKYDEFLMMHNGGIQDFEKIKYHLVSLLDEEAFIWIKGQNDTQYILALFMTNFREMEIARPASHQQLVDCFNKTFLDIENLKSAKGIDSISNYNIVLTDGKRMIATRYCTDPKKDSRSLHFAEKITCNIDKHGGELMLDDVASHERSAALISSERLTGDGHFWKEIPQNHLVVIDANMEVNLYKLEEVKNDEV
ncbi:class II glutamine amidotransferase [Cryomorphaceae bacterium 1068]|nr:class II glutamine amidotransferase [Cryomorphaceae bacterium 1068]